jgi:hypothetical protein
VFWIKEGDLYALIVQNIKFKNKNKLKVVPIFLKANYAVEFSENFI